MASYFCTECGVKIESAAKFCGGCGAPNTPLTLEGRQEEVVQLAVKTEQTNDSKPVLAQGPDVSSAQMLAAPLSSTHQTTVVIAATKSVGVAIILSIIFGPLGMLYSTVTGGITMMVISLLVGIFTLGFGLFLTWPICVIWAAMAANGHNSGLIKTTTI